jgi:hypothetical protein
MAYLIRIIIAFAAMLAAPRPTVAQDVPPHDAGWLFVVQGTVTAIDGTEMALAPDRNVVAFTERPARQAQLLVLADFVASAWGEGGDFRRDPPNASLVDENKGRIGVITMTDATFRGGTLRLEFVGINGALPETGDRIALTIDPMHPTQFFLGVS